jgi:hypothetical protein
LRYGVTVRQAGGQQRCTGRSNPYRFVIWNHATPLASHRRGHANRRQWWAATTSRARRRHAATMRSAAAAARGGRGRAKPLRRYAQLRWSASDRQRASAPCSRVTVNREVRQDKTLRPSARASNRSDRSTASGKAAAPSQLELGRDTLGVCALRRGGHGA